MFPKKLRFYQLFLFGFLILGLVVGLVAVGNRQEIRKKAAEGGGFTFAVIGDTHAGIDPNEFKRFHEWANYNHAAAIGKIRNINPDFYLHLGDMVQDPTNFAWGEFFSIESSLINSKPIYPTVGNHERYTENKSFFYKFRQYLHLVSSSDPHLVKQMQRDAPWYSFDWGNTHFVSLRIDYDSYYPQGEACRPGSAQYQWLENDLKNTDKPWKIVFFHVPIYSSTSELSSERKGMRQYLHPLFRKYGVDLIFGGHDHYYERVEAGGIIYVESGGGSNRRWPPRAIQGRKKASEKNHIVKVIVDEGQLTGIAISTRSKGNKWTDPGGQTLDTFRLTKQIQPTLAPTIAPTSTPVPTPTMSPGASPSPSPTTQASTLNFKVRFAGLPEGKQGREVAITTEEMEFLTRITLEEDGVFSGLSLSGVNPGGEVDLLVSSAPYLIARKTLDVLPGVNPLEGYFDFGVLKSGDLNRDNVINGLDWSQMKQKFGQSAVLEEGDLNLDGQINGLDWSIMSMYYGQKGE